ncbi:MAG: hypothetical protein ABI315_04625 [Bacteroidia bacterium]
MKSQLILGSFNSLEASDMITQLIQVKIKFHENKINISSNEEDIKFRESKIKGLQNSLFEIKKHLAQSNQLISIHSEIIFN